MEDDASARGAMWRARLLVRARLDSAVPEGALRAGAVFSGSLTDAVFNPAVRVDAVFSGANLTNARFDDCLALPPR